MKPVVRLRLALVTVFLALVSAFLHPTLDSLVFGGVCLVILWLAHRQYGRPEPDYRTERKWILGFSTAIVLFLGATFRQMLEEGISLSGVVVAAVVSGLALLALTRLQLIQAKKRAATYKGTIR